MKSAVVKRSIVIQGRKTSVSLENEFWECVRQIATRQEINISALVHQIDLARQDGNLSSAIRVFVLGWVRAQRPAVVGALHLSQRERSPAEALAKAGG